MSPPFFYCLCKSTTCDPTASVALNCFSFTTGHDPREPHDDRRDHLLHDRNLRLPPQHCRSCRALLGEEVAKEPDDNSRHLSLRLQFGVQVIVIQASVIIIIMLTRPKLA